MRLHFQKTPWDLFAAMGYTVATSGVVLALNVGNLAAILLVLFIPGYVLVAALFPGTIARVPEIDWVERIALSLGLSVAVVPLLGFLLNFTPFGIRFAPIVVLIALFTIGVGGGAYWRRMRLPVDDRLSLTVDLSASNWKEHGAVDKGLTIALAGSIAVAVGTLAYVVTTPRHGEPFTEFYLLGPGGNASGYPTSLNVSQSGSIIVGVVNHESGTVSYTVRIDLVGVRIVHNATSGSNETVELNRTIMSSFNVTLANSQNWSQPYTFQINYVGLWKIQFLLLRGGEFPNPYRELQLYVRIE